MEYKSRLPERWVSYRTILAQAQIPISINKTLKLDSLLELKLRQTITGELKILVAHC